MEKIFYSAESFEIVGAAIEVWKKLEYGFLEKVYENALAVELERRAIPFQQQKPLKVNYAGRVVGEYVADLIVDSKILLEPKSVQAMGDAHIAQVLNYLKATGIRLGIILNFGPEKMESKRVVL